MNNSNKITYSRKYTEYKTELRAIEETLWYLNAIKPQRMKGVFFYLHDLCNVLNWYKRYSNKEYGFDINVRYTPNVALPLKYIRQSFLVVQRRKKWKSQDYKN